MNIVLLIAEDTGRHQGCYGDPMSVTPRIDQLAREGVRYTNAFSHSPVCSPSRCGLVTGRYPTHIGAMHHRSKLTQAPRMFTHELRDAGWFVAWPGKQDFNFEPDPNFRDSKEDWLTELKAGRWPSDRPMFLYRNLGVTHESSLWPESGMGTAGHPPRAFPQPGPEVWIPEIDLAKIPVPKYLPDCREVRDDLARYYRSLAAQDFEVGQVLDAIDRAGLREKTLVIYLADHGRGLPREKRWIYEAGIHLPLIMRWPGKLPAGEVREELVTWVDLAPTILSLAGVTIPPAYEGRDFLGANRSAERERVYLARDRMDETVDAVRGVRDKRMLYLRNIHPDRPYLQPNRYMEHMPTLQALRLAHSRGELESPAQLFMRDAKPADELYDCASDPDCVRNLAGNREWSPVLDQMRAALEEWLARVPDLGLRQERELIEEGILKRD